MLKAAILHMWEAVVNDMAHDNMSMIDIKTSLEETYRDNPEIIEYISNITGKMLAQHKIAQELYSGTGTQSNFCIPIGQGEVGPMSGSDSSAEESSSSYTDRLKTLKERRKQRKQMVDKVSQVKRLLPRKPPKPGDLLRSPATQPVGPEGIQEQWRSLQKTVTDIGDKSTQETQKVKKDVGDSVGDVGESAKKIEERNKKIRKDVQDTSNTIKTETKEVDDAAKTTTKTVNEFDSAIKKLTQ
jgi:prefoldin subunit 5